MEFVMSKQASPADPQDPKPADAGTTASVLPAAEGVSVDKIRDILFGNQMQDYDKRFAIMEERFTQKIRELESELNRSISSLDNSIKKQLDSIANQFREEKDLRTDGDKELGRNMREQTQALEKRLSQLSDQMARVERDFTDRLNKESQNLFEEIKRKNDDTRQTMEKLFSELGSAKTDRKLLANLLVEVAKCLNQDFTPKLLSMGGDSAHT
jgi:predicted transcriptional regulator